MKRARRTAATPSPAKAPARRVKAKPAAAKPPPATPPQGRSPKKALFDQYRQEGDDDVIGPEGVERLCADLGVDPSDRKVLLLAWKMGAQRMGFFSRAEFQQGLRATKATTLAALKKALPGLEAGLRSNEAAAQEFYQFAFRFCLTEKQQKFVDIDTAVQMLQLALPGGPHTARFAAFMQQQSDYKVVSADQWSGFYRFSQEVKADLSDFDDSEAWPLLLDNYVEWARTKDAS